jgi:hypothetical protein
MFQVTRMGIVYRSCALVLTCDPEACPAQRIYTRAVALVQLHWTDCRFHLLDALRTGGGAPRVLFSPYKDVGIDLNW